MPRNALGGSDRTLRFRAYGLWYLRVRPVRREIAAFGASTLVGLVIGALLG